MHHFTYRDGRLHAEDVDLRHLADSVRDAVLLLFLGDARAALPRLRRGLRRHGRARLLRRQGELEPGRAGDACPSRRRDGHRLGRASCAARLPRRCRPSASSSPASARPRTRWRPALDAGILCFNVESRARARGARRGRGREGPARADLGAGQPGRRREDPPQDLDRQVGEQVRHPDRARPRGLCARGAAPGARGHRRRHAHRQPDHRARAVRQRDPAPGRARPRPPGGGARASSPRPRRRARHPLSRATIRRLPSRRPTRRSSSATRRASASS